MADRNLDLLLRSKMDASDIVQDTCSYLVRAFPDLKATNRLQFVAYVTTVLKHRLEDLRRRFLLSQKRNVYRERPIAGSQLDNESKFADGDMAVLDKLLDQEVCDRLYVALNRLPRELQRVLRWRFRKEMTYQQLGEKLQRSDDDVRMLVKRCLVRLKSEVFPNGWSG